jgi:TRAP-type C4-dicarboxylate transport system permease small subunit
LRAAFNSPITGTVELVSIFSAIGIGFALAYSAYNNAQISVSFLIEKLSRSWQNIIDCGTNLLSLVFWGTAVYFMIYSGQVMAKNNLMTATLYIPLYPIMYLLAMGFVVLCMVFVVKILEIAGNRAQ